LPDGRVPPAREKTLRAGRREGAIPPLFSRRRYGDARRRNTAVVQPSPVRRRAAAQHRRCSAVAGTATRGGAAPPLFSRRRYGDARRRNTAVV